jgi:hypothetical protein
LVGTEGNEIVFIKIGIAMYSSPNTKPTHHIPSILSLNNKKLFLLLIFQQCLYRLKQNQAKDDVYIKIVLK